MTKIEAARLATASGVTVVIANGSEKDVLLRVAGGETIGTRFLPVKNKLDSRERWLLSGLCTRGKFTVDDGAAISLEERKIAVCWRRASSRLKAISSAAISWISAT